MRTRFVIYGAILGAAYGVVGALLGVAAIPWRMDIVEMVPLATMVGAVLGGIGGFYLAKIRENRNR
jgi:hypothetical protein